GGENRLFLPPSIDPRSSPQGRLRAMATEPPRHQSGAALPPPPSSLPRRDAREPCSSNHGRDYVLRTALLAIVGVLVLHCARAVPFDDTRHLLVRTGFDPTQAEVEALAPLTWDQA